MRLTEEVRKHVIRSMSDEELLRVIWMKVAEDWGVEEPDEVIAFHELKRRLRLKAEVA